MGLALVAFGSGEDDMCQIEIDYNAIYQNTNDVERPGPATASGHVSLIGPRRLSPCCA